jgi:hypothetical protein
MINKEGDTMIIEDALGEITSYPKDLSGRYYNSEGKAVPRVTEILSSMMHNDSLMYWANSLGFKHIKYRDALNAAADIGTNAHNAIENFLSGKPNKEENIPAFSAFMTWYNMLTNNGTSIEVLSMEQKLTCKWFGGTYDLLVKLNGRVFLVDFKTSNHITYKYFLQLAAYEYMLNQNGIFLDGFIILQLSKETDEFNEYILDMQYTEHKNFMGNCTRTFLSLVYAYYNVEEIKSQYDSIF